MRKVHIKDREIIDIYVNNNLTVRLMRIDADESLYLQHVTQNSSISLDYGAEAKRIIDAAIMLEDDAK